MSFIVQQEWLSPITIYRTMLNKGDKTASMCKLSIYDNPYTCIAILNQFSTLLAHIHWRVNTSYAFSMYKIHVSDSELHTIPTGPGDLVPSNVSHKNRI